MFATQYPSQFLLAIRFSLKQWHRNLALPRLLWDFGLLILYSFCQSMENIRTKTFHFLWLKSVLGSFREKKIWLRWLFTWSLQRFHSQMLSEEKVREQAHIPAWCSQCRALLWCVDQAVSILQLPGVSVLFPLSRSSLSEEEDLYGFIQA